MFILRLFEDKELIILQTEIIFIEH